MTLLLQESPAAGAGPASLMWDLDHRQAIDTTPNKRTETGSLCGRRVSHRLLSMRGAVFAATVPADANTATGYQRNDQQRSRFGDGGDRCRQWRISRPVGPRDHPVDRIILVDVPR